MGNKNLNSNIQKLAKEFIENSDYFNQKAAADLDKKHEKILGMHYENFDLKKTFNIDNFRNWQGQNDLSVPLQLRVYNFMNKNIFRNIAKFIFQVTLNSKNTSIVRNGLLDDFQIIDYLGASSILQENPVCKTPGANLDYRYKGYSFNARWLRYIYLANKILSFKLKSDFIWLDVGSYYGGLQGLVKKYKPDAKIVLVDFNHQLCRSYIYLKSQFKDCEHILPNNIHHKFSLKSLAKGSIVYLPIEKFNWIARQEVDLATNFFSFGEMMKETFMDYYNSNIFSKAKIMYTVNRFVSGPFFDKTYENGINVTDYVNTARKKIYFDVFPMHYSNLNKNKLFGKSGYRPTSSQYFELIVSFR